MASVSVLLGAFAHVFGELPQIFSLTPFWSMSLTLELWLPFPGEAEWPNLLSQAQTAFTLPLLPAQALGGSVLWAACMVSDSPHPDLGGPKSIPDDKGRAVLMAPHPASLGRTFGLLQVGGSGWMVWLLMLKGALIVPHCIMLFPPDKGYWVFEK